MMLLGVILAHVRLRFNGPSILDNLSMKSESPPLAAGIRLHEITTTRTHDNISATISFASHG